MPFDPMGHKTDPVDLAALARLVQAERKRFSPEVPLLAVEVGSWAGQSALAIAQPGVYLFCVDHWRGNQHDGLAEEAAKRTPDEIFATFCRNTQAKLCQTIFPIRCESLLAASWWPRKVDLVFLDGEHTYEAVKADIQAWRPHVKNGGVLCGHDFRAMFPGVIKAVTELGGYRVDGTVWWKRIIH